jgi:ribosomal protein L7Ae-like RNA K-turn-binding protein
MDRTLQLLGLAMRAGKVISGEESVLREVRAKAVYLVILANDVAPTTEKKLTDKCRSYQIPLLKYGTRVQLGQAIGKGERVVLAIREPGFTRAIQKSVQ